MNTTDEVKQDQLDEYQTPKVVAIGKAVDLLQGGQGKHTDGYSGYYWNNEE